MHVSLFFLAIAFSPLLGVPACVTHERSALIRAAWLHGDTDYEKGGDGRHVSVRWYVKPSYE